MRKCKLCGKKNEPGKGPFFNMPSERRQKWSNLHKVNFSPNDRVCADHFSTSDFIENGPRKILLPKAIPVISKPSTP